MGKRDLVKSDPKGNRVYSGGEYLLIKEGNVREGDRIIKNELRRCNITEIRNDGRFQFYIPISRLIKKFTIVLTLKRTRKHFRR